LTDLRNIRIVISDFDGVMTDNRVLVWEDGREGVLCSRADGLACSLLLTAGIETVIISTERNPVVSARARKLGIEAVQDCADKGAAVRAVLAERSLAAAHAAFIGNDVNDLPAFGEVGVRIAPSDAHSELLARADIVTHAPGGGGVLREVADILLGAADA
jgi:YrbI family 3-deoxy-D-manno-octulosonate 8-phosphate phosphatase